MERCDEWGRVLAGGLILAVGGAVSVSWPGLPGFFVGLIRAEAGGWLAVGVGLAGVGAAAPSGPGMFAAGCAVAVSAWLLRPEWRARRLARRRGIGRCGPQASVGRRRHVWGSSRVAECFFPEGPGPRPLVVVVHGGGWEGGHPAECAAFLAALSGQGCVVMSVNYRLGQGWAAARDDVLDGLREGLERAGDWRIDRKRVFLLGRSAGGQIVSALACGPAAGLVAGCVCLYAPFDLVFAYTHSREDDVLKSRGLLRRYLGGTPVEAPENYRTASAWLLAEAAGCPFLILHGSRDVMVSVEQSRRFAARLRALRLPHRYLELDWTTHSFDHVPHGPGWRVTLAAVRDFVVTARLPDDDSGDVPPRN